MTTITKRKYSSHVLRTGRTLSYLIQSRRAALKGEVKVLGPILVCAATDFILDLWRDLSHSCSWSQKNYLCMWWYFPSSVLDSRTGPGRKDGWRPCVQPGRKGLICTQESQWLPWGVGNKIGSKASYKGKPVKRDPPSDPQSKDVFLGKQNGLQPLLIAGEWFRFCIKGQKIWEDEKCWA